MTPTMNQPPERPSTSPQSGRQSLAQGEASPDTIGTSGILGFEPIRTGARFSGRQKYFSPANAIAKNNREGCPRLRFACPRLSSGVRFAASLPLMSKNFSRLGLLALLVIGLSSAECTRQSNGISSGTGGLPSSATPAQVSSSAEVVKVTTEAVHSSPGNSADAIVRLAIASGYHVNANPATYPYLIATELKTGSSEGISAGAPTYPASTKEKFEFADDPLAVYEGSIEVKLPLKINSSVTTGERPLPITVRVQACDTEKCFPPATINAAIPIEVK
jgi:cytochrome c biogenesis DsbD-like protein